MYQRVIQTTRQKKNVYDTKGYSLNILQKTINFIKLFFIQQTLTKLLPEYCVRSVGDPTVPGLAHALGHEIFSAETRIVPGNPGNQQTWPQFLCPPLYDFQHVNSPSWTSKFPHL